MLFWICFMCKMDPDKDTQKRCNTDHNAIAPVHITVTAEADETRNRREGNEKECRGYRFFNMVVQKPHHDRRQQQRPADTHTRSKDTDENTDDQKEQSVFDRRFIALCGCMKKAVYRKKDNSQQDECKRFGREAVHDITAQKTACKTAETEENRTRNLQCTPSEVQKGAKDRTENHLYDRNTDRVFDIIPQIEQYRYQDGASSYSEKARNSADSHTCDE